MAGVLAGAAAAALARSYGVPALAVAAGLAALSCWAVVGLVEPLWVRFGWGAAVVVPLMLRLGAGLASWSARF